MPPLEENDVKAWNFYNRNARAFVQDFGLMEGRVRKLGLRGIELEMFEEKLAAIHDTRLEIDLRNYEERRGGKGPEDIVTGDENG